MFSLAGKMAIITGAGTGIGTGIALEMAKAGAALVLGGRRLATLEDAANQVLNVSPSTQVHCMECDVRNQESCTRFIQRSLEIGPVHTLVNNAGIEGDVGPLEDLKNESWDDIFDTNVRSNFYLSKAIIPHFRSSFESQKSNDAWDHPLHVGSIIVLASIAGKTGIPNLAAYSASNFARIGFVKSLALELAPIRVTVNALCPGVVFTPMWDRLSTNLDHSKPPGEVFQKTVDDWIPLRRPQSVEDMGKLAVFLATQPNLTAQDVYVDGGQTHF